MRLYVFMLDNVMIMVEAFSFALAVEILFYKGIIVSEANSMILGDGIISSFYRSYAG